MTSRRDFARSAGGFGFGAVLGIVPPFGQGARPLTAAPATAAPAWADVRAYGARGDGKTDDTAAIQRVLDERSAGVVYLPPGGYVVTRTLRVRSAVSIVGDGPRGSYLLPRMTDGSPTLEIGFPDGTERLRGMRLADFTIRGRGTAATAAGGLRLHAVYDGLVENVRIETLGWGLECDRAIAMQFDKLTVTGMSSEGGLSGEGVYLYNQSNGCLFNNLRSGDHAGAALRLGDGQDLTLVAPVIESTRASAIVVGARQDGTFVECRGVTILNPYFEKNRPHDMAFLRGTPPTIIGGYWGPLHRDYFSPFRHHVPITAIGCAFPRTRNGVLHIDRPNASALFLGCTFNGEVANFSDPVYRDSASIRVMDATGDRTIGGA